MYKGVEGSFCWFYLIFLKYPIKMKYFGILFHFYRIFKNGVCVGGGGGQGEPVWILHCIIKSSFIYLFIQFKNDNTISYTKRYSILCSSKH